MTASHDRPSGSNTFTIEAARTDANKHPLVDVEFSIDTERKDGELLLSIGLRKGECERLYAEFSDHEYPEDCKQAILQALEVDA